MKGSHACSGFYLESAGLRAALSASSKPITMPGARRFQWRRQAHDPEALIHERLWSTAFTPRHVATVLLFDSHCRLGVPSWGANGTFASEGAMSEIVRHRATSESLRAGVSLGADAPPRVLYVDDQQRALEALARVLWERFEVVTTTSPHRGLSLLEQGEEFAVVIADLKMPEMDGLTFLKRVQALSPTTTRLVMTGLFGVDAKALVPGTAFRLIEKPCPPEILIAIVTDAANYHELLATSPIQPVEPAILTPLRPPPMPSDEVPRRGWAPPWTAVGQPLGPRGSDPRLPKRFQLPGRIGLRTAERTVELLQGNTTVGRSRTCHIPLDDPGVSRQHACFLNDGRELTVRNLTNSNVVLLNGVPIEGVGPHHLEVGDLITIGSRELQVDPIGDYCPSLEPTAPSAAFRPVSIGQAQDEIALVGIADLAAKYVELGQWHDAERILRPLLDGLLRFCSAGRRPQPRDLEVGIRLALSLAEFNRAGEWVSYVFDLLTTLSMPAEPDVIERLYRIVPNTPRISMASYRSYLKALEQHDEQFGVAQRFLVRRIRGLEHALKISAHV